MSGQLPRRVIAEASFPESKRRQVRHRALAAGAGHARSTVGQPGEPADERVAPGQLAQVTAGSSDCEDVEPDTVSARKCNPLRIGRPARIPVVAGGRKPGDCAHVGAIARRGDQVHPRVPQSEIGQAPVPPAGVCPTETVRDAAGKTAERRDFPKRSLHVSACRGKRRRRLRSSRLSSGKRRLPGACVS